MTTPRVWTSAADAAELADPIAGVIASELSDRWRAIAAEGPSRLRAAVAAQEHTLRSPGGADWALHVISSKLSNRLLGELHPLLRRCLPLPAAVASVRVLEEISREAFAACLGEHLRAQLGVRDDPSGVEVDSWRDRIRRQTLAAVSAAAAAA